MKTRLPLLLAALLWGAASTPLSGQPVESGVSESAVLGLTERLADAWVALDADRFLGWFAEDFDFYFEGARGEPAVFAAGVRATMDVLTSTTFDISDPRITPLGPDAAAISFMLHEELHLGTGESEELNAAVSLVWLRTSDGWRIVSMHESLSLPG